MAKKIKLKSYHNLILSSFDRIKTGQILDKNLRPYSTDFLIEILTYLEDLERYEDCQYIKNLIDTRSNHDINYKNIINNQCLNNVQ